MNDCTIEEKLKWLEKSVPVASFPAMGGKIQWKKEDHPVEVIGRLRQNSLNNGIVIQLADNKGIRIKSESGQHMDFSLDGISWSEEALQTFYDKYIKTRVEGVKSGGKCTIVMYGATGSGKSYTMFGDMKEGGIAYRALHHIMDEGDEIVKVSVLEIYNEEVCDLLARTSAKGGVSPKRVRLDVRGGKVKNSCLISGKKADDIVRDIQLVEKKRVVKSTNCNERSSRSHCIITVDVPSVRGQLVLVDMAGSENIDQAAIGIEAKMQTGKINQGNGALKRVVEAIANGDNYIPYRDSKLTMLLQDSFEDDKAKILMILCASTDPKDIYKTIGTLEYGSKAKCIVKLPKSPVKEKIKATDQVVLQNRINVMLDLIERLQAENQLKDEYREKIEKELIIKNQQVENLKCRVTNIEGEKYQFLEYVEKVHEKLLKLIYTIEINRQIITKKETKLYKNMQEHQAKISEFINMVQSIEDEIICKISERQHQKGLSVKSNMAQNSYSLTVNSGTIPNCLTTDATGISIPLISRKSESTLEAGASNELQVRVDSAMSNDPNIAYNEGSQILSCSGFKKMINLSTSHTEDSCPDTRPAEDQKTSEKIRHNEDNTKKHSLRDWDEEVQFTVVCNDSEHQAVICRSCDQIDDLSALSDIESEVLEPSVQVCSSADLHILKESNDEKKHPAFPSKVFHQGDDGVKTNMDICNGTNTASVKSPNKSSMFSDVARDSNWAQSSGTNNFFDVDWTGGVSFTGWLPAIPETSFEGEEDGEVYEESKENDEKSHQGIENVDKKVIERENTADSSKGEPNDSNMIVGVSFTGWLPLIPETSFEGEEDGEVYEESKENDEKSHQGIENVDKKVIERENMADSSKGEPIDSNMIVDGSQTDPSKIIVHLPNDGNICELALYSKTGSSSNSDEDYKSLQIEIDHNDEENGCREAIQIDNGSRIYIETQSLCGNSLLPTVCEKHSSIEEVQEEIQTTTLNLEGANGERTYTSPFQSGQKPQFSNDDSLRYFELGVGFDIDVDVDTALKKHPRYNHEEIEAMELVDSSMSLSEGIEVMELEDSPTSCSEEIEIVKQACSPVSLSMSLGKTDLPLSQLRELSASNLDDTCDVDVYVKWGKSTEKLDKLICIVSLPKTATLAELRKEITAHVAHANKQFTFLMLGESDGGEVDQETENELRVGSLPDCLDRKGCHLACLRPPRRIKLSLPPDRLSNPLVQIENKIPNSIQTVDKKKGSNSKSSNAPTFPSLNKGGLRTLPSKKDRSKTTFKDKAKALNFQDLACTLLHGV